MRRPQLHTAAFVIVVTIVAAGGAAVSAELTIDGSTGFELRSDTPATSRTETRINSPVGSFRDTDIAEADVALLGCDVAGADGPEVVFLQIADRRGVIGNSRDFLGENCAEILSALLDDGLLINESRPVSGRFAGVSGERDILVWDLIRE